MFRHLVVVSLLSLSLFGFSFASDNNIYCEYPETQDAQYVCQKNKKVVDVPSLQLKNIKSDQNGILGDIYYNSQLLRQDALFSSISTIGVTIDTINKNFFLSDNNGDACYARQSLEKIGFNGTSLYTVTYLGIRNPSITLETSKYTTTIYFSDDSKNYIKNPTTHKYTGLYMKKVSKATKKTTVRTLYSFAPIVYNNNSWESDGCDEIFDISPSVGQDRVINGKYYVFQTRTRKIQLDLTNTGKSIITRIK